MTGGQSGQDERLGVLRKGVPSLLTQEGFRVLVDEGQRLRRDFDAANRVTVVCTCGKPWWRVTPPPPCPIHTYYGDPQPICTVPWVASDRPADLAPRPAWTPNERQRANREARRRARREGW